MQVSVFSLAARGNTADGNKTADLSISCEPYNAASSLLRFPTKELCGTSAAMISDVSTRLDRQTFASCARVTEAAPTTTTTAAPTTTTATRAPTTPATVAPTVPVVTHTRVVTAAPTTVPQATTDPIPCSADLDWFVGQENRKWKSATGDRFKVLKDQDYSAEACARVCREAAGSCGGFVLEQREQGIRCHLLRQVFKSKRGKTEFSLYTANECVDPDSVTTAKVTARGSCTAAVDHFGPALAKMKFKSNKADRIALFNRYDNGVDFDHALCAQKCLESSKMCGGFVLEDRSGKHRCHLLRVGFASKRGKASFSLQYRVGCGTTAATTPAATLPVCMAPAAGSRGACDTCVLNSQCSDGHFCCPFQKRCLDRPATRCNGQSAECEPRCDNANGNICTETGCDCTQCTNVGTGKQWDWLVWANVAISGADRSTYTATCKAPPPTCASCVADGCFSGNNANGKQSGTCSHCKPLKQKCAATTTAAVASEPTITTLAPTLPITSAVPATQGHTSAPTTLHDQGEGEGEGEPSFIAPSSSTLATEIGEGEGDGESQGEGTGETEPTSLTTLEPMVGRPITIDCGNGVTKTCNAGTINCHDHNAELCGAATTQVPATTHTPPSCASCVADGCFSGNNANGKQSGSCSHCKPLKQKCAATTQAPATPAPTTPAPTTPAPTTTTITTAAPTTTIVSKGSLQCLPKTGPRQKLAFTTLDQCKDQATLLTGMVKICQTLGKLHQCNEDDFCCVNEKKNTLLGNAITCPKVADALNELIAMHDGTLPLTHYTAPFAPTFSVLLGGFLSQVCSSTQMP